MKIEIDIPKKLGLSDSFLNKCENLDFEVFDPAHPLNVINFIADMEVTPLDTGYTQSKNAIETHGREKWLVNNNLEYGQTIYNGYFTNFHREKNKFAQHSWFVASDAHTTDYVCEMINNEIKLIKI